MKYLMFVLVSVCLLLCGSSLVAEQVDWEVASMEKVAQPPQSLTLEYKFPEGEARRYEVKVAGTGILQLPGQESEAKLQTNSELTLEEQVLPKTGSDGIWRISRKLIKGQMTLPDFGQMVVSMPTMEIEMDKCGAVRSVKGLDQLSSTFGMPPDQALASVLSQMKSPGFPKKELKINDSWEDQYAVQVDGQKPIPVKVTSTLIGFDRVLKADCATIVTKYEVPFSFAFATASEKATADAKAATEAKSNEDGSKKLVGVEKGEFRTYFSYTDGKITQSYGTIELIADFEGTAKPKEESAITVGSTGSGPTEAKPAVPPTDPKAAAAAPKHNLDVKYYVTSMLTSSLVRDVTRSSQGGAR